VGLLPENQRMTELLTNPPSFEQTIEGNRRSFTMNYIDWAHPENNVYHVTDEFSVQRRAHNDTRRPDIVLFVNGIPLVVIECKRPDLKGAVII
jgi:type I restriction enzyme R subunit